MCVRASYMKMTRGTNVKTPETCWGTTDYQ